MGANPLSVGVTGGIGSGKSTVSRLFELFGVQVYYADDRAKQLMATSPKLIDAIKAEFGPEAYHRDGQLNRGFLARHVFADAGRVSKINQLVHPAVHEDFLQWKQAQQHQPYVLKEAALLVEAGSYNSLQYLILVSAPAEERLRRVLLRDEQRSADQVREIMEKQLSDVEKRKVADVEIHNDNRHSVIEQVLKVRATLEKMSTGLQL